MGTVSGGQPRLPVPSLQERVAEAVRQLDPELRELLSRRYGLFGTVPQSSAEIAEDTGESVAYLVKSEARALRALMGYTKRKSHYC